MNDADRIEHFHQTITDLCKAAATANLVLEITTCDGQTITGVANCRAGDRDELMRIGEIELTPDHVIEVKVFGP
jgi:hypothetical protein